MALVPHTFPGLDKPVYLPDWITVSVEIAPNTGNWRRGPKGNRQTKTTWHDTGNPNTTARQEATWARNGRSGAGVGSYNGVFDNREIIILQPFDEVVYAAGTTVGNETSYAFEQALKNDYAKSLEVGYALHGGIIAAKGWNTDTALVKHQYWYGKWCPGQILNRGIWSTVVKGVSEAAAAATRAALGDVTDPKPQPVYAAPSPIAVLDAISKGTGIAPQRVTDPSSGVTFVWIGDRVRAITDTPRCRFASKDGEKIGPNIRKGDEFDVDWIYQMPDGSWWLYTPYATRVYADDTERVSDVKGAAA